MAVMLSSLHYEYDALVDAAFVKKKKKNYMQQITHLGSAHVSSLTGTFSLLAILKHLSLLQD